MTLALGHQHTGLVTPTGRSPRPCSLDCHARQARPVAGYGFVSGEVSDAPSICTRRFRSFPAASGAAEFKTDKSMCVSVSPAMGGNLSSAAGHLNASWCLDTVRQCPLQWQQPHPSSCPLLYPELVSGRITVRGAGSYVSCTEAVDMCPHLGHCAGDQHLHMWTGCHI